MFKKYRLQLKRGLFWYRHYLKLHQMVKYRNSGADFWTNLPQISSCVFFNSKPLGKMPIWSKKHKHIVFGEKILDLLHASHQSWQNTNVPI